MKKTITESELRRLVEAGMTHGEIAKTIGRHATAIAAACHVLGIRNPSCRGALHGEGRGRPNVQGYLIDMRAGLSVREIGQKHGKSKSAIHKAMKSAGLPTSALALLRAEAAQKATPASTTFTAGRFASFMGPNGSAHLLLSKTA